MGKIEDEIQKIGFKAFMDRAKTVTLADREKILFKALCSHDHAFNFYVDFPTEKNWNSLSYHMKYHRLYPYEDFKECYDRTLTYILDLMKGKSKIGFMPASEPQR